MAAGRLTIGRRVTRLSLVVTLIVWVPLVKAAETEVDPATGLRIAPGWELARAHCGACHSYRLVTAQRGDDSFWRSIIAWMQKTQNLWQIPPDQETRLIDYLSTQYNETDWGRRPPLSPALMPGEEAPAS